MQTLGPRNELTLQRDVFPPSAFLWLDFDSWDFGYLSIYLSIYIVYEVLILVLREEGRKEGRKGGRASMRFHESPLVIGFLRKGCLERSQNSLTDAASYIWNLKSLL